MQFAVGAQSFTLDQGLLLNFPAGDSIPDNSALTYFNGVTTTTLVRFSRTGVSGGNIVSILATDTPEQVANKVRPLINAFSPTVATLAARPGWVNAPNAPVGTYAFTGGIPAGLSWVHRLLLRRT